MLTGKCLCGGIRFEITAQLGPIIVHGVNLHATTLASGASVSASPPSVPSPFLVDATPPAGGILGPAVRRWEGASAELV